MTAPVDVLAVMERDALQASQWCALHTHLFRGEAKARPDSLAAAAAMVGLIAAANAALNQDQVELPGWLTEQLSAALARIGGAA